VARSSIEINMEMSQLLVARKKGLVKFDQWWNCLVVRSGSRLEE